MTHDELNAKLGAFLAQDSPPIHAPQAAPWPTPDVVLVAAPDSCVHLVKPDFRVNARRLDNPWKSVVLHDKWGMTPEVLKFVRTDKQLDALIGDLPDQIMSLWGTARTTLPITVLTTCRGAYHRSIAVNVLLADALADMAFHVELRSFCAKSTPNGVADSRIAQTIDEVVRDSQLLAVVGMGKALVKQTAQVLRDDLAAELEGFDGYDDE